MITLLLHPASAGTAARQRSAAAAATIIRERRTAEVLLGMFIPSPLPRNPASLRSPYCFLGPYAAHSAAKPGTHQPSSLKNLGLSSFRDADR